MAMVREGEAISYSAQTDRPLDLVGNIRTFVEQERARRARYGEELNAAWFLRTEIDSIARFAVGRKEPEEKVEFFDALRIAWQLRAYGELEPFRSRIYGDILTHSSIFGESITLDPLGVTLLDAMAEAIGIEEHTPGQAKFDISLFSEETMHEKAVKDIEFVPTTEEVRQAITPKPEKIIDTEQQRYNCVPQLSQNVASCLFGVEQY